METAEYALMDEAEDRMWWYRALHARLLTALAPLTGRLLDAGCGTGGFLSRVGQARPDLEAHGVEFFPGAAARAAKKSPARIIGGSVNALPYAGGEFDVVVAADVLCHAAVDPARALREFARVLRAGGTLIVNMPAFSWLASSHDRRVRNALRQNAGELRASLAAGGFEGIRARYWNGLPLPLMIVQRKFLARRDEAASDVAAFPPWLEATFHAMTSFEQRLPFPMPAGGSVMAVATVAATKGTG